MRFQMLGQLAIWDGRNKLGIPGGKQRALLAFLLVSHGQPVSAERIIDELWGVRAPSKARNALQAKVSSLRGALAPSSPDRGRALVRADDGGYWLDVPEDAIDAARFEHLVSEARLAVDRDQAARAYALLDEALALWQGEPLSEFGNYHFAVAARQHLTGRYLTAVEMHATAWLSVGGDPSLPDQLLDTLAEHPLRESLRALTMRALARQGRQAEAIEVFGDGRALLAEELGVDPGPELRAAHADVLAQRPAAGAPGPRAVVQLPAESTSFVGRRNEELRLRAMLARERLVTITGPGGIGKTRLVVHTLATMTAPVDGIWFTDLREVAENGTSADRLTEIADVVLRTVRDRDGASLGNDERVITDRHRDPLARMCDGIGHRDAVLVLDNSEHVCADVAAVARKLLVTCPGLKLVATTRVLLGLVEESVLRLEPLAVPLSASRDDCLASEAVALFCARAGWDPEELSEADLARVTAIVRRTEGIPLAMEVAAGLLRSMMLADVAEHLRADRELLQRGNDGTLNDTIDRSWNLLGDEETDLLTRVSTIEGGWGLDAAYALAGPSAHDGQVAATVARLVDRSLISYDPATPIAPYRLLEAIRDYASRKLTGHPLQREIALAHAGYFLRLAERADSVLRGAEQPSAFALFGAAHADVVTAARTFLDEGEPEQALRVATALGWYSWLSGRRREGRAVLSGVLAWVAPSRAATPLARTARAWAGALGFTGGDAEEAVEECIRALDELPPEEWDTGLFLVAILVADRLLQRGDPVRGRRFREQIEAVAERVDDQWYTAAARFTAGIEAMLHGRLPEGRHYAEASLAGFRASEDRWGQTQSLDLIASLDEMVGDYRAARRARERVIDLAETLGLRDVHAYQLVRVGNLCALEGDLAVAERLLCHARDLAKQLGISSTAAYADNGLGLVLRRAGRPQQAQVRHEAVLRHYRAIGSISGIAFTSAMIGLAASAAGMNRDAMRWQREALHAADVTGDRRAVALVLECLAVVLSPAADAAVLLGAASALRADAGAPRPVGEILEVDRVEAQLGECLSPGALERATLTGKSWAADGCGVADNVNKLFDR